MGAEPARDQLLVGIEEAADRLGVGRTKARELVASGALRSVRIGNRRLVPVAALTEYVTTLQSST